MTGKPVMHVTADRGYAHSINYRELDTRGIDAVIPVQRDSRYGKGDMSVRRFKYDGLHRRVTCPRREGVDTIKSQEERVGI